MLGDAVETSIFSFIFQTLSSLKIKEQIHSCNNFNVKIFQDFLHKLNYKWYSTFNSYALRRGHKLKVSRAFLLSSYLAPFPLPPSYYKPFLLPSSICVTNIYKQPERVIFKTVKEPRNRFQGIDSACLCSPACRYDTPIFTRFLAHIDCYKIPALLMQADGIGEG
jgi:hypothetical protein